MSIKTNDNQKLELTCADVMLVQNNGKFNNRIINFLTCMLAIQYDFHAVISVGQFLNSAATTHYAAASLPSICILCKLLQVCTICRPVRPVSSGQFSIANCQFTQYTAASSLLAAATLPNIQLPVYLIHCCQFTFGDCQFVISSFQFTIGSFQFNIRSCQFTQYATASSLLAAACSLNIK